MSKPKNLTPNYDHVCDRNKEYRGKVYEPEADSFLFLDALDADKEFLHRPDKNFTTVLEIGVGSGIVCTHCCFHCLPQNSNTKSTNSSSVPRGLVCFGLDINKTALKATAETWEATRNDRIKDLRVVEQQEEEPKNKTSDYYRHHQLFLLHTSGLGAIRSNSIDLLLFNPPYVPTSTEEMLEAQSGALSAKDELPAAWAGGIAGREICDKILPEIPRVLSFPNGVAYVVAIQENNIPQMLKCLNREESTGFNDDEEDEEAEEEEEEEEEEEQQQMHLHHEKEKELSPNDSTKRKMKATVVSMRWTGEHLRVVRFEFC